MKKRPFMLLELLVALSLVGAVSFSIATSPVKSLKLELDALMELEESRQWDLKLMEIRAGFSQNCSQFPLEEGPWSSTLLKIPLPWKKGSLRDKRVAYKLWIKDSQESGDKTIYHIYLKRKLGKKEVGYDFFFEQPSAK